MIKHLVILGIILIANLGLVSAVIVKSVFVDGLIPGGEGTIRMEIENNFEDDVTDVSLRLNLINTPFTPVGNSEFGVDELRNGEEEDFVFKIKAANDITPGDYQIPYIMEFKEDEEIRKREGTIGVMVQGTTELSFSISTNTPVIGKRGKIDLKIINKGFNDADFVSIKIFPAGFTLLSEDEIYVGTVDSDDFETATFDVIFNNERAKFVGVIEYRNFDNERIIENVEFPLIVYSEEKAIELGIVESNNLPIYLSSIVTLILVWILWRVWRRARRLKKSLEK